ncbi:MAG: hypothetical protein J6T98_12660 [Salinivirgaceae bacterium]|nr:hypothetical protein [Salinivirgaceae bacterium]
MKKTLILCMAACLFAACEDNLERSIWISDPDDFNLPKYTEWGYNTFGAKMDGSYFLSCWRENPCSMEWHANDSTLEFTMNGCQTLNDYMVFDGYITKKDYMSLTIIFPCDSVIDNYKKLYLLDGKTIDLTDTTVKVLVTLESHNYWTEPITDIRSGELCFKRIQNLYVDGKFEESIVSGTFDIRYVKDGEKTRMSDGRFDIGINQSFFW